MNKYMENLNNKENKVYLAVREDYAGIKYSIIEENDYHEELKRGFFCESFVKNSSKFTTLHEAENYVNKKEKTGYMVLNREGTDKLFITHISDSRVMGRYGRVRFSYELHYKGTEEECKDFILNIKKRKKTA